MREILCWKCKNSKHENGCDHGYRHAAGAAGQEVAEWRDVYRCRDFEEALP